MDTTELQRPGDWRFDRLDALPDDGRRYEVVDGLLVVSPPPSYWHQTVSAALLRQLSAQAPLGWRVLLELGLPLGTDGRVPDLSVVSASARVGPGRRCPDPSTSDWSWRWSVRRAARPTASPSRGSTPRPGMPLFWRVETAPDLLAVAYRLRDGTYEQVAVVGDVGAVPAPWGPARLDLAAIRHLTG